MAPTPTPYPTPTPTPDVPVTNTLANKANLNTPTVISTGQSTFIGDNTVFTDNLSNGIQTYLPVYSTSQVHSKGFRLLSGTTNNYFVSDNLTIDCCGNYFSTGAIDISGSIRASGTASFSNNKFTVDASGAVSASNGLFTVDRFANVNASGSLQMTGTAGFSNNKFLVDASGAVSASNGLFAVDRFGNIDASGNLRMTGTAGFSNNKFTVDASGALIASNGLFTVDRLGAVTASKNFVSQSGNFSTTGGNFTTTGTGGFATTGSGSFTTNSGSFSTDNGSFSTNSGGFSSSGSGNFTTNGGSFTTAGGNFTTGFGSFSTTTGNLSTTLGGIVGKDLVVNNGNNYLTLDSRSTGPLLRFNKEGLSGNNGTFILDSSTGVIKTFGTISSTGAITSSGALTGARLNIGMDASNNAKFTIDSTGAITTQNYSIANSGSAKFANQKFIINDDGSISASNANFVVDSSGSITASKNISASGTASFLGGNFTIDSTNGITSNNNFAVDVNGNMNKVGNIASQGGLSTTQSIFVGGTDVSGANVILSNNGVSNFKQGVSIGKSAAGYNFVVDTNGNLTTLGGKFTVDSTNGVAFNNKFAVDLSGDIVAAGDLTAAGVASLASGKFTVDASGDIVAAGSLKTSKFYVDSLGNLEASGNLVNKGSLNLVNGNFTVDSTNGINFNNNKFSVDANGNMKALNNNFSVDSTNGIAFYNKFNVDLSGDIVAAGALSTSNFSVAATGDLVAAGTANLAAGKFTLDASANIVAAGSLKTSNFYVDKLGNLDACANIVGHQNLIVSGSANLLNSNFTVDATNGIKFYNNKFSVDLSGAVVAAGNLSAAGALSTSNFNVAASGDVVAAGSLKTSKFYVDSLGNLEASGNLVNKGTLNLVNGKFTVDASGNMVTQGALTSSKFKVDKNGNVDASGNLSVSGTASLSSGKFTVDDNGIGFFNKHVTTNTAFSDYTLPLSITDDYYTYYDPTVAIPAQDVSAMTALFATPTNNRFTTQEYVDKVLYVQTARINNLVGPDASAALQQLASYQKLLAAIDGTSTANIINSLNTSNYQLLNTISNTISTGYNPVLINCVPSIWGAQCPPRPIPTPITQTYFQDGWFFANEAKENVINWYLPASANLTLGSITNLFINFFAVSNVSVPSISILTNRGQITYSFNTSSSIYTATKSQTAYKTMCLYTNTMPSNIYNSPSGEFPFTSSTSFLYSTPTNVSTLNLIQTPSTSFQTSYPQLPVMNNTDTVEYFCVQTSTTTNPLDVMFILQSFNVSTNAGTTKMLFKNGDVINNYIMNKFFKQYTDFSSTSNNNALQLTNYVDYFNKVVNNNSLVSSSTPGPSNFNTNISVTVNTTTTLNNPIASVVNVGSSTTSVPIVITPDSSTDVITATLTNTNGTNVSITLANASSVYSATISNLVVGDNTINITSAQSSTSITSLFSIVIHRYSNDSTVKSIQVYYPFTGTGTNVDPVTGYLSGSSGRAIVGAASTAACSLASGSLINLKYPFTQSATLTVTPNSSTATYKIAYPSTGALVSPTLDGNGNLNLVTSALSFGNNYVKIVTTGEETNSPSTTTGYINLYVLPRDTTLTTFQVKTKSSPVTYTSVTSGNTVDIDSALYGVGVASIMNVAATSGSVGSFSVVNSNYASATVNGNIAYGLNTVSFTVTAQNTDYTQPYTVNVYCTSTTTTLSSLMIGGVSSINGTSYASLPNNSTINLAPTTTSVQIVATPSSSIGTVSINGGNYNASSTYTVSSLTPGSTATLTIVVKSSQTNPSDLNYTTPSTSTYTYNLNVQDTNLDSLYYSSTSANIAHVNNNQIAFDASNNASVNLLSTGQVYQKLYLQATEDASGNTLTYDLSNNAGQTVNNAITSGVTFDVSLAAGFNYVNIKDTSVDGNYNKVYNLAVNNTSNDVNISSASWINADMSGVLVIGSQPSPIQLDVSGIVTLSAAPECAGAAINMYTLDANNNYTGTVVNNQINVNTGATVQVGMFTTALNGTTTYPSTPQVTATFVGPAAVSSNPVITGFTIVDGTTVNNSMTPSDDYITVPSNSNLVSFSVVTTLNDYRENDYTLSVTATNEFNVSIPISVEAYAARTMHTPPIYRVVIPRQQNVILSVTMKDTVTNNTSSPFVVKFYGGELAVVNVSNNPSAAADSVYVLNDVNFVNQLDTLNAYYTSSMFPLNYRVNQGLSPNKFRLVSHTTNGNGDIIALVVDGANTYTQNNGVSASASAAKGAVLTVIIYSKSTNSWEPHVISNFGTSQQYVNSYAGFWTNFVTSNYLVSVGDIIRNFTLNRNVNILGGNTIEFKVVLAGSYYYQFVGSGTPLNGSTCPYKQFTLLHFNTSGSYALEFNTTTSTYDKELATTRNQYVPTSANIERIELVGSVSSTLISNIKTYGTTNDPTTTPIDYMTYIITYSKSSWAVGETKTVLVNANVHSAKQSNVQAIYGFYMELCYLENSSLKKIMFDSSTRVSVIDNTDNKKLVLTNTVNGSDKAYAITIDKTVNTTTDVYYPISSSNMLSATLATTFTVGAGAPVFLPYTP
jgi:hypothetical protein